VVTKNGGPERFTANRRFVFLVRHDKTGAILFLGRLVDPGGVPVKVRKS